MSKVIADQDTDHFLQQAQTGYKVEFDDELGGNEQ
jgi:hypothetical protein